MSAELLVKSILSEKAADAQDAFESILAEKLVALTEVRKEQLAESMFAEETLTEEEQIVDALSMYFVNLVEEEGATIEEALQAMANDEDIGPEITENFVKLLESVEGPEDEEDEEESEDESDED